MPATNPTPTPEDEFQDIMARFLQTEQARMDDAKKRLRSEIIPRLVQHRVANIEAAYSGYGDSGAIDGLQFRDSAGQRVDRASVPKDVMEHLENCIYEFLPSGFEVDDGSQGTLTLDVATGRVSIQHQANVTETRDSSREFTI